MAKEKVFSCPFCGGGEDATVTFDWDQLLEAWYGRCNSCGAQGPTATTETTAKMLWGHRDA